MQQIKKTTKAKRGVLLLAFALLCGLTAAMAAIGGKTSASADSLCLKYGAWSYDPTISADSDGTMRFGLLKLAEGDELPRDNPNDNAIWSRWYFALGEFDTYDEIDNANEKFTYKFAADSSGFYLKEYENSSFFKRGCTYSCYVFSGSFQFYKNNIEYREDEWYSGVPDLISPFGYGAYKLSDVFSFTIPDVVESLPEAPQKEGHHFAGWYYDEEFTEPYQNTPINEDTTLYAKFEINRYSVTFRSLYGSVVEFLMVDWNTVLTDLPIPTQKGWNFLGWYIDDNTPYTDQPIKQDITLVAKWQVQMFTVTFMVEGSVYRELDVPYGTRLADVSAAKGVDMNYYNLYDVDGVALGGETVIEAKTTINAVRMTPKEASATFLVKYNWLLWLWGAITVVGVAGFTICAVWIKKH